MPTALPLAISSGESQSTVNALSGCNALRQTIYVGTDGLIVGGPDDGRPYAGVLRGTAGPDVIVGTAGSDVVHAGDGDDRLCGFAGDDQLNGDAGNDVVFGGDGDDQLSGGDGEDTLLGEAGNDAAVGGGAFDNCDAETSQECEWAAPVRRVGCFYGDTWDVLPGTGHTVEATIRRPPASVGFSTIDGAPLPDNSMAQISTYYTAGSDPRETLLTDWLIPSPQVAPAVGNSFQTTLAPFAPYENRGQRLLWAYVTASAPGIVTVDHCVIRMNVLDPQLLPSETTLTATAGSTTPILRTIDLLQAGPWSFFTPKFHVEIAHQPTENEWLSASVVALGSAGVRMHFTADASNLSPGTYTAEVIVIEPEYRAVAETTHKVTLIVSPPVAGARPIRLHGSDGEPSGRPVPTVRSPGGSL